MATKTETAVANGEPAFVPDVPGPSADLVTVDTEAYCRARLAQKLAAISSEIGTIPKNGHNDHFNYDYVTDSDVADALRQKMAKHGVAMIPRVRVVQSRPVQTSKGRDTFITEVVAELDLICTETGAVFTVEMPGAGEDGMDKGCYKGTTGAVKYALLKAFNISTGDDPERSGETSDGGRSSGGRDDRPITEKQRKVIFGRASGLDIEASWIPRIIRSATKGKAQSADDIQTNGQLDFILGQLAAFAANPVEAKAAVMKWEQDQLAEPELPPEPNSYDHPDDFRPADAGEELPF